MFKTEDEDYAAEFVKNSLIIADECFNKHEKMTEQK